MCNQQGGLETRGSAHPPVSAPAPRPALTGGGRAAEVARAIPVVSAAPARVEAPLPPAAIPEVRAAVAEALSAPVAPVVTPAEPVRVEAGPTPVTLRIKLSEFNGNQKRNLGRVMGDKMHLKGIGLITFKQESGEIVVTLPQGKDLTVSQMTSVLQNHLNRL